MHQNTMKSTNFDAPPPLPAAGPAPKALPLPERTRDLANILGRLTGGEVESSVGKNQET